MFTFCSDFLQKHYNYIITGAGCAGLSLLMHLLQHDFFKAKRILLIDKDIKQSNDRTWCFWETQPGLFESIVHHRWQQLDFYSTAFSARFDIGPYEYKMIRGIDFYNYVLQQVKQYGTIRFIQDTVVRIEQNSAHAIVTTEDAEYTCDYIFNSIVFKPELLQQEGSLLQHFKGWLIQTPEAAFNKEVAVFMDFRATESAANTFVYTLPVAGNKALVEYTVFSPALLEKQAYDEGLKNYIRQYLKLSAYTILEEEFGVIPMSTYTYSQGYKRIVNMGTAGGQTKGSSGYTFRFIQKHAAAIVKALTEGKAPHTEPGLFNKRFQLYDNTLLNILYKRQSYASDIFSDLFKKNKPQQVFKFLDNETTFGEELKIMSTVPFTIFLPAALRQLLR